MNKNRKIRSSILKLQAEPVICINNIKGYYIQAVSMSLASFLTKTNVSVIHKFIKKGRETPTSTGWIFYPFLSYMEKSTTIPKAWDCEIHQVYLAKGAPCPLCKYEKKKALDKLG